ncbi:hypothetical protein C2G38_2040693 [Gigaspora rosea]|uniref:Uncharacterized protein n=1 Tax=Gigaspora rosea TaxID=44941 RepID=A0A397UWP8_9GLOM|nr:hypothetical protein C2G38_2040693 [Gigaspora rosea]
MHNSCFLLFPENISNTYISISISIWTFHIRSITFVRFIKDYILDINRLKNLLKNNEIHFLSNLFPPAKVELDEEVNEYLDNIFSIFKSKETFNAENIFEEVEQKRKLVNLGIKTLKERQITFIFDTVQKLDSASISSKHNKLQNFQDSANGTRPDFTVQNYSNYEIFTLEVAGSPTNKIQKKIKTDFAKLSRQMRNNIKYIVAQEKKKGRSLPKNFQIFGALTEGSSLIKV